MKKKKIRLPKIKGKFRLLLCLVTLVFCILSVAETVFGYFPFAIEIAIYVIAAVTLTFTCFYLACDLKRGVRKVVRPVEEKKFERTMERLLATMHSAGEDSMPVQKGYEGRIIQHSLNRYVEEAKIRYDETKSFRHDIRNGGVFERSFEFDGEQADIYRRGGAVK